MDRHMVAWRRAQVAIRAERSKGRLFARISFRAARCRLLASHACSRLYGRTQGANSAG